MHTVAQFVEEALLCIGTRVSKYRFKFLEPDLGKAPVATERGDDVVE